MLEGSAPPETLGAFPPLFPNGYSYQFTQDDAAVIEVRMVVPKEFKTRGGRHNIDIGANTLRVKIEGEEQERIKGKLYQPVINSESYYTIEDSKETQQRHLVIWLTKTSPVSWPLLIRKGLDETLPDEETKRGGLTPWVDVDPQSLFHFHEERRLPDRPTPPTEAESLSLLEWAADRGNVPALIKLAMHYDADPSEPSPLIPTRNSSRALELCKTAATLGSHNGALFVADAHLNATHGIPAPSKSSASHWLEYGLKIMDSWNGKALDPEIYMLYHYKLGTIYGEGEEGWQDPDPVRAIKHFEIAALLDHAHAMYHWAYFLLSGFGCEQDVGLGVQRLRLANVMMMKRTGSPGVYFMLPECEGMGLGVELDVLVGMAEVIRKEYDVQKGQAVMLGVLVEATRKCLEMMGGVEAVERDLQSGVRRSFDYRAVLGVGGVGKGEGESGEGKGGEGGVRVGEGAEGVEVGESVEVRDQVWEFNERLVALKEKAAKKLAERTGGADSASLEKSVPRRLDESVGDDLAAAEAEKGKLRRRKVKKARKVQAQARHDAQLETLVTVGKAVAGVGIVGLVAWGVVKFFKERS
ncbi:hypothetical protein HDV00_012255 [Rhizophlyctis rosea]|nr:hypothetical protein HDV00_012255 [Rhizophlyctis rosea]